MHDDDIKKQMFLMTIIDQLGEHPDWLPDAIKAMMVGSAEALKTKDQRIHELDRGLQGAIALMDPKWGKNGKIREICENDMIKALGAHPNMCELEFKKFAEIFKSRLQKEDETPKVKKKGK